MQDCFGWRRVVQELHDTRRVGLHDEFPVKLGHALGLVHLVLALVVQNGKDHSSLGGVLTALSGGGIAHCQRTLSTVTVVVAVAAAAGISAALGVCLLLCLSCPILRRGAKLASENNVTDGIQNEALSKLTNT